MDPELRRELEELRRNRVIAKKASDLAEEGRIRILKMLGITQVSQGHFVEEESGLAFPIDLEVTTITKHPGRETIDRNGIRRLREKLGKEAETYINKGRPIYKIDTIQ